MRWERFAKDDAERVARREDLESLLSKVHARRPEIVSAVGEPKERQL